MGTLSPLRYANAGAAAALRTALLVKGTGLPPVPATGDGVAGALPAIAQKQKQEQWAQPPSSRCLFAPN